MRKTSSSLTHWLTMLIHLIHLGWALGTAVVAAACLIVHLRLDQVFLTPSVQHSSKVARVCWRPCVLSARLHQWLPCKLSHSIACTWGAAPLSLPPRISKILQHSSEAADWSGWMSVFLRQWLGHKAAKRQVRLNTFILALHLTCVLVQWAPKNDNNEDLNYFNSYMMYIYIQPTRLNKKQYQYTKVQHYAKSFWGKGSKMAVLLIVKIYFLKKIS